MSDGLHALTLGDVLREHGRSRPQHLAAIDGEVRLTYADLDARVDSLAQVLADAGVARESASSGQVRTRCACSSCGSPPRDWARCAAR